MIAIHPSHVAVINEVFTPSAADDRLLPRLGRGVRESCCGAGTAPCATAGVHIDKAHYDKALEWLERAEQLRARDAASAEEAK